MNSREECGKKFQTPVPFLVVTDSVHLAGPTELNYQIKVPEGKAIPVSLAAQQMPG